MLLITSIKLIHAAHASLTLRAVATRTGAISIAGYWMSRSAEWRFIHVLYQLRHVISIKHDAWSECIANERFMMGLMAPLRRILGTSAYVHRCFCQSFVLWVAWEPFICF